MEEIRDDALESGLVVLNLEWSASFGLVAEYAVGFNCSKLWDGGGPE